jgi:hypothetical protein
VTKPVTKPMVSFAQTDHASDAMLGRFTFETESCSSRMRLERCCDGVTIQLRSPAQAGFTGDQPTFTGTSVIVSLPKMSITFTATV